MSKVLLVSICLLAGAAAPRCGLALESPERFTTYAAASTPLAVSTDGSLLAFGTSSGSCILLRERSGRLEKLAQTEAAFSYPAALVFEHNSDSVLLLDRRHSLYRVNGSAAELLAQDLLPDSMVFGCEMRPGPAGTLIPGYYDISLCSGKEIRPVYTAQLGASDTEGGGMIVDCCWAGDAFVVAEIASIAAYNNPEASPNDSGGQTPPL
ncbi:hypothetical protein IT575_08265 [bacterium]|nr:hypothetical protein [bacterium]